MAEQNTGVVGSIIQGVGFLIVTVTIILLIVSTMLGANLLRDTATATTATETNAWINSTGYTLTGFSTNNRAYEISYIVNATDGVTIASGNYSFDSSTGIITNASATNWADVNVTYTYITQTNYENTAQGAATNLTQGIDNVSGKIPTILLIAAVVLLFGVLVLLVSQAQKMGLFGRGGSSL